MLRGPSVDGELGCDKRGNTAADGTENQRGRSPEGGAVRRGRARLDRGARSLIHDSLFIGPNQRALRRAARPYPAAGPVARPTWARTRRRTTPVTLTKAWS